jgi:hypothetical protein
MHALSFSADQLAKRGDLADWYFYMVDFSTSHCLSVTCCRLQFVGSGEPLDISTVTNEDPATAFGTGGL